MAQGASCHTGVDHRIIIELKVAADVATTALGKAVPKHLGLVDTSGLAGFGGGTAVSVTRRPEIENL